MLAAVTVLGLFLILGVPVTLQATQVYMLRYHSAPRALRLLRLVDTLRLVTAGANACLRTNLGLLMTLSVAIWLLELGALSLLAGQIDRDVAGSLLSLLGLSLAPQFAAASGSAIVTLYGLCALVTLSLAWPVATALYVARLRVPRRNAGIRPSTFVATRAARLHLSPSGQEP